MPRFVHTVPRTQTTDQPNTLTPTSSLIRGVAAAMTCQHHTQVPCCMGKLSLDSLSKMIALALFHSTEFDHTKPSQTQPGLTSINIFTFTLLKLVLYQIWIPPIQCKLKEINSYPERLGNTADRRTHRQSPDPLSPCLTSGVADWWKVGWSRS